ncbi:MAG: hypothetical protein A2908_02415 [Candidatus Staskawiczbacteria bacterium RIFCSPLOWO2_01_FULL_38_12b]|uniref:EfeO-type cupredoxin-like domain-containing protein n=1 Tax=Candidatus Staskawiczbacteria bacterium RIFCSPLOWO2_01_FULL_38_12b TaxID=1802214 RepID=A0A1G2IFA5_9BACT|nr:MAG: hypothetical protein A2908_02415 [Candidatus Staskawiczbacteria bacterium RIFCSPLOWO2_01_FULL_38_12b]
MNKTIIVILILVVIALGGYFLLRTPEVQAPGDEVSETPTLETPAPNNTETPEMIVTPTPSTDDSSSVSQNIVTYSDTGYSPSTLNVKVGDAVTFKNSSSLSMWTASAQHPTHAVYPTTGGCFGSTFDACKGVLPGESWSFKFDQAGNWKYHDHLKPSVFGTIVVK